VPLAPADQEKLEASLAAVRQKLDDSDAAAAWVEGWAMPLEKAIEAALSPETV
jgi:hypothetical protein